MSPEHAKAAADLVAAMWESEFPATCQVLAAVKDNARDYRPDPKSRTAWELATHLATADVWFLECIVNGAFVWNPDAAKAAEQQFTNVDALVDFYRKAFPEKLATLRAVPAEQMTEVLDFFGFMKMSRAQFVAFANNHSVHHRGQLAAYLRAMGSKVPNIYGPSADDEVPANT
jgi:uncharacterized damage-inducible protein DinB